MPPSCASIVHSPCKTKFFRTNNNKNRGLGESALNFPIPFLNVFAREKWMLGIHLRRFLLGFGNSFQGLEIAVSFRDCNSCHEKKTASLSIKYWLLNRDPYSDFYAAHRVVCHPLYTLNNQGPFFQSSRSFCGVESLIRSAISRVTPHENTQI